MKLKKIGLLALMAALVLVLAACAPKQPEATPTPAPVATEAPAALTDAPAAETAAPAAEELKLTLEELAKFNGKDGAHAYVAVDGVIYDVTDSKAWANGAHNGFEAGKDLTKEIKEVSPHGVAKLENVVRVGVLVTE